MPALGVIGGIIGVVVFLGAVVVYLRGSSDKGTIRTLQMSNEALIQRVAILEGANLNLSGRVTSLEHENAALKAQRPSAKAIAELQTLVEEASASLAAQLERHDAQTKKLMQR